jgi:hypothetical protein
LAAELMAHLCRALEGRTMSSILLIVDLGHDHQPHRRSHQQAVPQHRRQMAHQQANGRRPRLSFVMAMLRPCVKACHLPLGRRLRFLGFARAGRAIRQDRRNGIIAK